jgi:hypothetical protein
MNSLISHNKIRYTIILTLYIGYVSTFPNGAPQKTCKHNLPIGSGKSHHGSYPPSDSRLSLTLFDSSNQITTEYLPNSIYTLQVSSTQEYTGYLFGAFDSVSGLERGDLSYFTTDLTSKKITGVGCITQNNEVSFMSTKIIWTSPSSTEKTVNLQSVVTFDGQSSLITISVKGDVSHTLPTSGSESSSGNNNTNSVSNDDSMNDKHTEPFSIKEYNIVVLVFLVVLLILVCIIVIRSFINISCGIVKKSANGSLKSNKTYKYNKKVIDLPSNTVDV